VPEPGLVANLLIESAAGIARSTGAMAIIVSADALPEGCEPPEGTLLLTRRPDDERRVKELGVAKEKVLQVPQVELDRMGQVKLAALVAISRRLIDFEDTVVFLTGPYRGLIDSLVVLHIGSEYELLHATEQPTISEHIKRTVFQRSLDLALHLGAHGREGRRIGAMLVVGDINEVLAKSEQMILNPFKGYPEKSRNILDQRMTETIREYAQLDGAILIRGNGVIESAAGRPPRRCGGHHRFDQVDCLDGQFHRRHRADLEGGEVGGVAGAWRSRVAATSTPQRSGAGEQCRSRMGSPLRRFAGKESEW